MFGPRVQMELVKAHGNFSGDCGQACWLTALQKEETHVQGGSDLHRCGQKAYISFPGRDHLHIWNSEHIVSKPHKSMPPGQTAAGCPKVLSS